MRMNERDDDDVWNVIKRNLKGEGRKLYENGMNLKIDKIHCIYVFYTKVQI